MKVRCTIDSVKYTLNVNSDKSLHSILTELSESFPANNTCMGASCGNCVVLFNGKAALSCLLPACKLEESTIVTFEAFEKTDAFKDIEHAYSDTGFTPCPQCYASKTLLIESIIDRMEQIQGRVASGRNAKGNSVIIDRMYIAKEMGLNSCTCVEIKQLEKVIRLAYQYRRKRHA